MLKAWWLSWWMTVRESPIEMTTCEYSIACFWFTIGCWWLWRIDYLFVECFQSQETSWRLVAVAAVLGRQLRVMTLLESSVELLLWRWLRLSLWSSCCCWQSISCLRMTGLYCCNRTHGATVNQVCWSRKRLTSCGQWWWHCYSCWLFPESGNVVTLRVVDCIISVSSLRQYVFSVHISFFSKVRCQSDSLVFPFVYCSIIKHTLLEVKSTVAANMVWHLILPLLWVDSKVVDWLHLHVLWGLANFSIEYILVFVWDCSLIEVNQSSFLLRFPIPNRGFLHSGKPQRAVCKGILDPSIYMVWHLIFTFAVGRQQGCRARMMSDCHSFVFSVKNTWCEEFGSSIPFSSIIASGRASVGLVDLDGMV